MANYSGEVLAELVRDNVVESVHLGYLIALNVDGSIAFSLGDTKAAVYPRSSIKSVQAAAMVRAGLKLEPRLLALVASSHSGSQMHQDAVLEILHAHNLKETDLQNMLDKPLGESERRAWADKAPTRLAMNCSGKHAGMLATCVINNWPTESYLDPEHPLQIEIKKELVRLSEESVLKTTADGCGAPLFLMTMTGLAKTARNITLSQDPAHVAVVSACKEFPEMVAGNGRDTTKLMQSVKGLFIKDGAEGVAFSSMPDGRAVVFKIADGSMRPYSTILAGAWKRLGVDISIEAIKVLGGDKELGGLRAAFN